jgi:hypothetical protein
MRGKKNKGERKKEKGKRKRKNTGLFRIVPVKECGFRFFP